MANSLNYARICHKKNEKLRNLIMLFALFINLPRINELSMSEENQYEQSEMHRIEINSIINRLFKENLDNSSLMSTLLNSRMFETLYLHLENCMNGNSNATKTTQKQYRCSMQFIIGLSLQDNKLITK
jgi:hypothetical protein